MGREMGTIATMGFDPTNQIVPNFREALKENINPKLSLKERIRFKLDGQEKSNVCYGYSDFIFGLIDGQFLGLAYNPYFPSLNDYRLVTHLSQIGNLENLCNLLLKAFGPDVTKLILVDWRTTRVDLWIDFISNLHFFVKSAFRHKGRVLQKYANGYKTFYWGQKRAKGTSGSNPLFRAYESNRSITPDMILKLKDEENQSVRLEAQFEHKKCPIKHLYQYPQLVEFEPFHLLNTRFVTKRKFKQFIKGKSWCDLPTSFVPFCQKRHLDGLHEARKKFNANRKFSTTIDPILIESSENIDLNSIWQRKAKEQIIGDFNIQKFIQSLDGEVV